MQMYLLKKLQIVLISMKDSVVLLPGEVCPQILDNF